MQKTGIENKIALAVAITGIFLLFFIEQTEEPRQMHIGEINSKKIGENVVVSGRILSFQETEKTIFFEISDGNTVLAVKFNPLIEERALIRQKQFAKITGKISSYKKQVEIIAEKVEEWTSH